MANEIRRRYNFISGIIDDNPLSNSATTLNSTELAGLPAVGSSEHVALVLDPTGVGNGPEIVWVTAHTGSATSATIVRAREGTSAVEHASTIAWAHVATAADFGTIGDDNDQPSSGGLPFEGEAYVDTTNDRVQHWSGSAWARTGHYSTTGRTGGAWRRSTNQSISDVTVTDISWDAEDADSDGFLTPTSATFTVPSGLGGIYAITVEMIPQFSASVTAANLYLTVGGTRVFSAIGGGDSTTSGTVSHSMSLVRPLAASDACKVQFIHNSGSARDYKARLYVYRLAI